MTTAPTRSLLGRALLLGGIALAAATPVAAQATDTIVKADGASVRGVEVTAMTLATVKFLRNKEEVELPGHGVTDVQWGGAPDAFASGLAAMQRNDFATARQLFGDAVGATERAVLKTEARFQQGKAATLAAGADAAAAANAAGLLRAWITDFPDGWRVPEATFLLGRALRLGKLGDDALTVLKDLDDRALQGGWGAAWSARAKYETAMTLLDQGKSLEARGAFQSAGSAADNALTAGGPATAELKSIKVNARVGEGETLVLEKQFQRAADFFRTLAGNEDPSLAASGKAGEGEATFLLAEEKKDAAALRRAQMLLAEAAVLDTGAGDTAAKVNYYLGCVLLALGDRDGADTKTRAKSYFQIVTRSYPASRWVGAAKTELAK